MAHLDQRRAHSLRASATRSSAARTQRFVERCARCLHLLSIQLLNTFSNFGATWPKWFVYSAVDALTFRECAGSGDVCLKSEDCGADGSCVMTFDGYYAVSACCLVIGIAVLWFASADCQ